MLLCDADKNKCYYVDADKKKDLIDGDCQLTYKRKCRPHYGPSIRQMFSRSQEEKLGNG